MGCEKDQILDRFQEGCAAGLNVEYKERKETGMKSTMWMEEEGLLQGDLGNLGFNPQPCF